MTNELEQAWNDLQNTPSYLERYTTTVEIEGQPPRTENWLFCLSCGTFVEDESHECERRAA